MSRLAGSGTVAAMAMVLLVAAGLRWAVATHAPVFLAYRDSSQFYAAAYDLVQGGGFDLPLKRAPLYPLFLAGVVATLGPSLEAVATVQHLLGLGTVLMVYALGVLVFGRVTGLLAALLTAINGALLLMEHSIVAEALLAPLLLASVLALLSALRLLGVRVRAPAASGGPIEGADVRTGWPARPAPWAWTLALVAGLLLGLGALARPVAQAALPLFLLVAFVPALPARRRLVLAGLILCGYGAVVAPWTVRNRLTHGEGAISGGLGDSLYARTHRYDTGFTWRDFGERPADGARAAVRQWIFQNQFKYERGPEFRQALQREFGLDEAQSDAALRDAALQVIRQEPGRYVSGTARMFVQLGLFYRDPLEEGWWSRTRPGYERAWPEPVREALEVTRISPRDQALVAILVGLYQDRQLSVVVGLLVILGSLRCLAGGPRAALLLPVLAASQILLYVALDGPHYRYRYPLQPFITLIACGGLTFVAVRAAAWARPRLTPWLGRDQRLPSARREPA